MATTPGIDADSVAIRHEPELKDGALELSKKGTIRFTHIGIAIRDENTNQKSKYMLRYQASN